MHTFRDIINRNDLYIDTEIISRITQYEPILAQHRDASVCIIEISQKPRATLDLWALFFPKATRVYAVGAVAPHYTLTAHSPKIEVSSDPNVSNEIIELLERHKNDLVIVIDSRSEEISDIFHTLKSALPMLHGGNLYIIEELTLRHQESSHRASASSRDLLLFMRHLSDLKSYRHGPEHLRTDRSEIPNQFENLASKNEFKILAESIEAVSFLSSTCVVNTSPKNTTNNLGHKSSRTPKQNPYPHKTKSDRTSRYPTSRPSTINEGLKNNAPKSSNIDYTLKPQEDFAAYVFAQRYSDVRQKLAQARSHPFRLYKHLLIHLLLSKIARSSLPISKKMRARFDKSARKRDPLRSLYETPSIGNKQRSYDIWMETTEKQNSLNPPQISAINREASDKGLTVLLVLCIERDNTQTLTSTLDSIVRQNFPYWRLHIILGPAIGQDIREVAQEYAEQDSRIKLYAGSKSDSLDTANTELGTSDAAFLVFINDITVLSEDALSRFAETALKDPTIELIYSDHDMLSIEGSRYDPHFKSGWNRDLLYSHNYLGPVFAVSRQSLRRSDVSNRSADCILDYENLLQICASISEQGIVHIPQVLYHLQDSSQRDHIGNKYLQDRKALLSHLKSHEAEKIEVRDGLSDNLHRPIWPLPEQQPRVSIIVPTKDQKRLVETAVSSILQKTAYNNFEIVIVDNASEDPDTLTWLDEVQQEHANVSVLRYNQQFNYSAINNYAISQTQSDIVALVNNDIEVINSDWLREMVSHAIRKDIGCVGAKLFYSNGQIQHAGVILGIGTAAGHSHKFFDGTHPGYLNRLLCTQNYSAVTGACLVLERSLYEAVGGLDAENLAVAYNDIDLCLKVKAMGYRNLWTPYAMLFHHESVSRGHDTTPEKKALNQMETDFMERKWHIRKHPDPFYNPNLTLRREDFSIGVFE